MKTLVNVARYHLVDRLSYWALPWGILAFSFLINLAISGLLPSPQGDYTGGLFTVYAYLLIGTNAANYDASFVESPLFLILP